MVHRIYDSRVELLYLKEKSNDGGRTGFDWKTVKEMWVNAESKEENKFDSSQTTIFILHPTEIPKDCWVRYENDYYEILRVDKLNAFSMKIVASFVNMTLCGAEQITTLINERKEIVQAKTVLDFPAVLQEQEQECFSNGMAYTFSDSLVVTTPKQIKLLEADVVYVFEKPYVVRKRYLLKDYSNRYEVFYTKDC